jgi:urea transport system ATP-binding protein
MAIVLVEQYFDFARRLADDFIVLERGRVVASGDRKVLASTDVRAYLTV